MGRFVVGCGFVAVATLSVLANPPDHIPEVLYDTVIGVFSGAIAAGATVLIHNRIAARRARQKVDSILHQDQDTRSSSAAQDQAGRPDLHVVRDAGRKTLVAAIVCGTAALVRQLARQAASQTVPTALAAGTLIAVSAGGLTPSPYQRLLPDEGKQTVPASTGPTPRPAAAGATGTAMPSTAPTHRSPAPTPSAKPTPAEDATVRVTPPPSILSSPTLPPVVPSLSPSLPAPSTAASQVTGAGCTLLPAACAAAGQQ